MYDFVPQDATLNKAFQLAYFINGDKQTAMKVLISSLERLETAVAAQDRRLYYTPSGKHAPGHNGQNGFRYKVSLSEPHLLQRLIYLMSEPFEIEKERSGSPSLIGEEDMIIHFLKHLVHITIRRNSFYVALGISRLLHNYTAGETADIYSAIGQPDRLRDDDYYRSRKRRVMQEIKERFGSLVGICRGPRAEERFIVQDPSAWKAKLVNRSLGLFLPWDTLCHIPRADGNGSDFYFRPRDPDEEHGIEVERFHALIHPDCYEGLTRELGLDPPRLRLQIPYFFLSENGNGAGGGPPSTRDHLPSLDEQDLIAIKLHMDQASARRKAASRGLLRVLADGSELVRLDPRQSSTARACLKRDANLIEVVTGDREGDLVLATHLLSYDEPPGQADPPRLSIVLEGGQRLLFDISRSESSAEEDSSLTIGITYQETEPVRAALLFWSRCLMLLPRAINGIRRRSSLKPALACAVIAALAIGALLSLRWADSYTRGPLAEMPGQASPPSGPEAAPEAPPEAAPQPPRQAALVEEQPASAKQAGKKEAVKPRRNSDPKNRQLARGSYREGSTEDAGSEGESERGPKQEVDSASLLEARNIHVQAVGEGQLIEQIKALLSESLRASGRFIPTGIENADAVLKISVRLLPASGRPGGAHLTAGRVSMTARLVNADGRVIWPVAEAIHEYAGDLREAASKAVADLMGDVRAMESRRK